MTPMETQLPMGLRRKVAKRERGVTLIEMLTVIMCIGILSGISIVSYNLYRQNAAYAAAETTLRNARTAISASTLDSEHPPGALSYTDPAMTPALFNSNAAARTYLKGFTFNDNVRVRAQYDPSCIDAACVSDLVEIRHCTGREFVRWFRMGDGTEVPVDRIPGEGCP